MARLVAVTLDHRDHFSHGNARRVFGYEAYHWSIIIMPELSQGRDYYVFDATDTSEIDPITFRLTNPTMDWWFRTRKDFDPTTSAKLLGRIVIGQVPEGISEVEVCNFFESIPLPIKNIHPQQSCVTWVVNAILSLQKQGWAAMFEIDEFKSWALSYADERLKGSDSCEPDLVYFPRQNRD